MKRIVAYLFLTITVLTASAQSSGLSVCGIRMGTPKSQAKAVLQDRFGKYDVHEDDGDLLVIGGTVGGVFHKFLMFHFTWINGGPQFNGAQFDTPYELGEQKDAIECRDFIKSVYEEKYDIEETTEDGFKCYYFGLGNETFGSIWLSKAKSNDGKIRLHLTVNYWGPYNESGEI